MKTNYFLKSLVLEEDNTETPLPSPGTISKEEAARLIKHTGVKKINDQPNPDYGKFFTVTFIKKDGSVRVMNARLGVEVYLKGGQLAYDAESKGLIPVRDMQAPDKTRGYRMININTITHLKIGGNEYDVE